MYINFKFVFQTNSTACVTVDCISLDIMLLDL